MLRFYSTKCKLLLYFFVFLGLKVVEVYLMGQSLFEPFGSDIPYLYTWGGGLILFYILYYFFMGFLATGFLHFDLFFEDRMVANGVFYIGLILVMVLPIFYYISIWFFSFYPKGYEGLQPPILFFSGMAARLLLARRGEEQDEEIE